MKKLSQNKSLAFNHWSKSPSFQKSTPLDVLEALLNEESTSCETTFWEVPSDPMFPLFANLDKSLGAMAESMLAMNQLLKCLCSEPSNATDDDPACKTCSMDAFSASEGDGEDWQGHQRLLSQHSRWHPQRETCLNRAPSQQWFIVVGNHRKFPQRRWNGSSNRQKFATFVNSQQSKKISLS